MVKPNSAVGLAEMETQRREMEKSSDCHPKVRVKIHKSATNGVVLLQCEGAGAVQLKVMAEEFAPQQGPPPRVP